MMPMEGEFKILNCAAKKAELRPGAEKWADFELVPA